MTSISNGPHVPINLPWESFHKGQVITKDMCAEMVEIHRRNMEILNPYHTQLFKLLKAVKKSQDDITKDFVLDLFKDDYHNLTLYTSTKLCLKLYEKAIQVKEFELPDYKNDSLAVWVLDTVHKGAAAKAADFETELIEHICYNLYTARVDWCLPYMKD